MTLLKFLVRAAAGGGVLIVALLLTGITIQFVQSRRDAKRYPPPGRLVDIGGRSLHMLCAGEGSPTILFEMGAGAWGLFWTGIHREMSKVTRACLYDRAGLGWSDPDPLPRSPDAMVADLRALVVRSGERGPFVLVGHSLGGLLIRLYQARYSEDVVGMALVESAHPRQWRELPPVIWDFTLAGARSLDVMARLAPFGAMRLLRDRFATQRLPAEVMPAYRATAVRPSYFAAFGSEVVNSEALAAEVEKRPDLGDLPLVVVSAARSFDAFRDVAPDWPFGEANRIWALLQDDLVTLSTRSWHHVSSDASHNIHSDDPRLVVTALKELVDTVRAGPGPPSTNRGRTR